MQYRQDHLTVVVLKHFLQMLPRALRAVSCGRNRSPRPPLTPANAACMLAHLGATPPLAAASQQETRSSASCAFQVWVGKADLERVVHVAVAAVLKQQPGELEHRHQQIVLRVILCEDRVHDVQHLGPVQQVGLFVRPCPVHVDDVLQALAELCRLAAQPADLLLHLYQPLVLPMRDSTTSRIGIIKHAQPTQLHARARGPTTRSCARGGRAGALQDTDQRRQGPFALRRDGRHARSRSRAARLSGAGGPPLFSGDGPWVQPEPPPKRCAVTAR